MTPSLSATSNPTEPDMLAIKDTVSRPSGGFRLRGYPKASPEKVEATAHEFEAQFISQMLSTMFATVDSKEALGGTEDEEVYRSMLVDEYGKIIARTGGIGVADHVKQIMLRQQEVESLHE